MTVYSFLSEAPSSFLIVFCQQGIYTKYSAPKNKTIPSEYQQNEKYFVRYSVSVTWKTVLN